MRKKWITVASALSLMGLMFMLNLSSAMSANGAGSRQTVNAYQAGKSDISSSISCTGEVISTEIKDLAMEYPVKIDHLLVTENQIVKKDEQLFQVDITALERELALLKSAHKKAVLELEKIKQMSISDRGANTSYLLESDKNSVSLCALELSRKNEQYQALKTLFDQGAIALNELENAKDLKNKAEINLKNAELNYKKSLENQKNGRASGHIDLKIQEQSVSDLELQAAQAEEKINTILLQSHSPIDGCVTKMNIVEGAVNGPGSLATIINTDKLQVIGYVSEYNIGNVSVGQKVIITGQSFPQDLKVAAKIAKINPVAQKMNLGTVEETVVEVAIEIENEFIGKPYLRPGLNVNCDIFTNSKKQVLTVQMDCLVEDKDDNKYIFTVDPKTNTVHKVKVEIGAVSTMEAEITSPLEVGTLIVASPKPDLKDGAKVKISLVE